MTTGSPSPAKRLASADMEGVTFHSRTPVPLVKDKVRHAGEAVGGGRSPRAATSPKMLLRTSGPNLNPGGGGGYRDSPGADAPLVHDDLDSNLASHLVQEQGGL